MPSAGAALFIGKSADYSSVRDRGVGGSNPLAPTKYTAERPEKSGFFIVRVVPLSLEEALGSSREARLLKLCLPRVLNAKTLQISFILFD